MRIVIVGAGAVGGVVAANLAMAGTPVVAVARGEHGRMMRESGLSYESPSGVRVVELPVAASVGDVAFGDDDVIFLGVKSQDTVGVLNDLRTAGVTDQPIVCLQNGVDNERQALRLYRRVVPVLGNVGGDHAIDAGGVGFRLDQSRPSLDRDACNRVVDRHGALRVLHHVAELACGRRT